jgi:hypothetical protein
MLLLPLACHTAAAAAAYFVLLLPSASHTAAAAAAYIVLLQRRILGVAIGTLPLPNSSKAELRLQLLSSTKPGTPVFNHLGNIQLTLGGKPQRRRPAASSEEDWRDLKSRFNWPEGQAGEESPYSPYDAEGIAHCEACQPPV